MKNTNSYSFKSLYHIDINTRFLHVEDMGLWNWWSSARMFLRALKEQRFAWEPAFVRYMLQRLFNSFAAMLIKHVKFMVIFRSAAAVRSAISMFTPSSWPQKHYWSPGRHDRHYPNWISVLSLHSSHGTYIRHQVQKQLHTSFTIIIVLNLPYIWVKISSDHFVSREVDYKRLHSLAGSNVAS